MADSIRSLALDEALEVLAFTRKAAAKPISEVIKQAIGNATNNFKLAREDLRLKSITIDEGPTMKRWRAGARGRIKPYAKRTSHITVVLEGKKSEEKASKKEVSKVSKAPKVSEGKTKKGAENGAKS